MAIAPQKDSTRISPHSDLASGVASSLSSVFSEIHSASAPVSFSFTEDSSDSRLEMTFCLARSHSSPLISPSPSRSYIALTEASFLIHRFSRRSLSTSSVHHVCWPHDRECSIAVSGRFGAYIWVLAIFHQNHTWPAKGRMLNMQYVKK